MKWTRRILISLLIFTALIVGLWWEENWRGQKLWEESCARLRAAGEPVEIADIIPPKISDEDNIASAPVFEEVMTASDPLTTRLGKISDGWLERMNRSRERFPVARPMAPSDLTFLNLWAEALRRNFPKDPPMGPFQSTTDEVLHFYTQFDEEWSAIREALRRRSCRWPFDYENAFESKTPHLKSLQTLNITSRGWLAALAANGDEAAFTNLLASLFKLERIVGREPPNLFSHLVGITMAGTALRAWQDSLPLVKLNDVQLRELQHLLEQYHLHSVETAMRNERVFVIHSLEQMPVHDLLQVLGTYGKSQGSWGSWPWVRRVEESVFDAAFYARPHGWEKADLAGLQDSLYNLSSGCVDATRDTLVKSKVDSMLAEARRLTESFGFYTLSRHMMEPTIALHHRLLLQTGYLHATVRSALVWCAAERFRLKHGYFPKSQEELVPEFLPAPVTDPINGTPLRYVLKGEDNLVVYSLGWNGKDDGGVRGGRREQEGDIVWASDPMSPVSAGEIQQWKDEDEERAERMAPQKPRKAKKPLPGSAP